MFGREGGPVRQLFSGGPSEPAVLPFGVGEADARVGSVHWEPHNSLWVGDLAFILIDSFKSAKKYSKK